MLGHDHRADVTRRRFLFGMLASVAVGGVTSLVAACSAPQLPRRRRRPRRPPNRPSPHAATAPAAQGTRKQDIEAALARINDGYTWPLFTEFNQIQPVIWGELEKVLSKWVCEQQADTFVRRYETMTIASLRFHWLVPDRATATSRGPDADGGARQATVGVHRAGRRRARLPVVADRELHWARGLLHRRRRHDDGLAFSRAPGALLSRGASAGRASRAPEFLLVGQGRAATGLAARPDRCCYGVRLCVFDRRFG